MKTKEDRRLGTVVYFLILAGAFFVLSDYIITVGSVTSGSMEKTLMTGDTCIYNTMAYQFSEPQRGDIIAFTGKQDRQTGYVTKRVIGIAGDRIEFHDGSVFINGTQIKEKYLEEDTETNAMKSFTVPDKCVFVLGDNRDNSYDSRYWKDPFVRNSEIRGRLLVDVTGIKNRLLEQVKKIHMPGSAYVNPDRNAQIIDSIPGIRFAVPSELKNATAITGISDAISFDEDITYSYQDGIEDYVLFNRNKAIILAQKGTSFNFDRLSKDRKAAGLENSLLLNARLMNPENKFRYTENKDHGGYKLIGTVSARIMITSKIAGDYTGKLAVITDGVNEYSVLAAAPGSRYEDLDRSTKQMIEKTVLSMKLTDPANIADPEASHMTSAEIPLKDKSAATADATGQRAQGLNLSNQKIHDISAQSSYVTGIYDNAVIGEKTSLTVFDADGNPGAVSMQITEHMTGSDVSNLLMDAGGSDQEAPEGTHWEAVRYTVDFTGSGIKDGYVNVRLAGFDGRELCDGGIAYSQRTHDIFSKVKTDGQVKKDYIAYYAVPDNCTGYLLICGENTDQTIDAYYGIHE
ncbi:MAG: signal peptidase I [Butyrivibrio sp.]|jgi:signal peptidase I|nr:signal peptidase I [Butyrivibrio sp.]